MYDDILVPTDGSDASMVAIEEAAALADTHGATLHVLYVLERTVVTNAPDPTVVETMESVGERALERARSRAEGAGAADIRETSTQGTPHESILDYVDENDIDLVVMGTHGRTGLGRVLLGSVTEKVVRLSPVPVLTVRSDTEES